MVLRGYTDFSLQKGGPADNLQFAHFRLGNDISHLFPYINALADVVGFFPKLPFIRFVLEGHCCGLHPRQGVCAPFPDRQSALDYLARLLDFLHEVHCNRHRLEPNYRAWNPVPALQTYKLLPRTNCRICGYPSCLAFAAALSRNQTGPEHCPGIRRPLMTKAIYPILDQQGNLVDTVTLDFPPNSSYYAINGGQAPYLNPPAPRNKLPSPPSCLPLTPREEDVLNLVVQGHTNLEIAQRLGLSHHTVKSHIISIFNKLAVNDRTQAAVLAVRHQLV